MECLLDWNTDLGSRLIRQLFAFEYFKCACLAGPGKEAVVVKKDSAEGKRSFSLVINDNLLVPSTGFEGAIV